MQKDQKYVKGRFDEVTKDHKMEIKLDQGLYRHLTFTTDGGGSSVYRFDIHTWPGYLCICGDMGTYTFSRLHDMFEFFRQTDPGHPINPSYWAEKLTSVDKTSGYEEFDEEGFEQYVKQEFEEWAEENYDEESQEDMEKKQEDLEDIQENVIDNITERCTKCLQDIPEYESPNGFKFIDFWDHSFQTYPFRYLWILFAIVYGIRQYDLSKSALPTPDEGASDT